MHKVLKSILITIIVYRKYSYKRNITFLSWEFFSGSIILLEVSCVYSMHDMLNFLTHYILLTNFSKLLKLRFLTHYIPFTYVSKLLKLRFLMQYILLTLYFSKLLKLIF